MSLAQTVLSGLATGALYALLALPFAVVLALTRTLNLAHGELVLLGGYLGYAGARTLGLPPLLLAPLAGLALAPLGLVWQALLARVREPVALNGLTLTFGLSLLVQNLILGGWSADYRLIGSLGPAVAGPPVLGVSRERLAAAALALAVFGALHGFLRRTRWGLALRATGRDAETAGLMGVDTVRTGAVAFVGTTALAGAGGVLFASFHYLHPAAGVELTLLAVTLAIFSGSPGGVGRLPRLFPAGLGLGLIESLALVWAGPRWRELVVVILLLAVLLVRPPASPAAGTHR